MGKVTDPTSSEVDIPDYSTVVLWQLNRLNRCMAETTPLIILVRTMLSVYQMVKTLPVRKEYKEQVTECEKDLYALCDNLISDKHNPKTIKKLNRRINDMYGHIVTILDVSNQGYGRIAKVTADQDFDERP